MLPSDEAEGPESLGDKLSQIQQSLGICHVAEVQVWPGCGRGGDTRAEYNRARAAVAAQWDAPALPTVHRTVQATAFASNQMPRAVSPSSPGASSAATTARLAASVPAAGLPARPQPTPTMPPSSTATAAAATNTDLPAEQNPLTVVHQPQPPQTNEVRRMMHTMRMQQPQSGTTHDEVGRIGVEIDAFGDSLRRDLDSALGRLSYEGSANKPRQDLISLGPATFVPPAKLLLISRLPQQLAQLRSRTKHLASTCDEIRSSVGYTEISMQDLKKVHTVSMSRAREMLRNRHSAEDTTSCPPG